MWQIFIAGVGGFIGAVFRVIVGMLALKFLPLNFPYGTLFVNIIGSFLIGIFLSFELNSTQKAFLVAGICGGFTTFSAFSYESLELLQGSESSKFILNLALNLVLSLLSCYLGVLCFKS